MSERNKPKDYLDMKSLLTSITMLLILFGVPISTEAQIILIEKFEINGVEYVIQDLSEFPEHVSPGNEVKIYGSTYDFLYYKMPNTNIGIHDGLALFSTEITSDENGDFIYSTNVVSDNNSGKREVMFTSSDGAFFSSVTFWIFNFEGFDLTSPIYLNEKRSEINLNYDFIEIENLTARKEYDYDEFIWSAEQLTVPGLNNVQKASDVNRGNYDAIIRAYYIRQTDPFYGKPEIKERAFQIRDEIFREHSHEFVDELKDQQGVVRVVVYVGGAASCAGTALKNPYGPKSCVLVAKMASEDLIKATGSVWMKEAGATQEAQQLYKDSVSMVFLLNSVYQDDIPSLAIKGAELVEKEIVESQMKSTFDIIETGYMVNQGTQSSSLFNNVEYSIINDNYIFNFEFEDQTYEAIIGSEESINLIYNGHVSPAIGNTSDTFKFQIDYRSSGSKNVSSANIIIDGNEFNLKSDGDDYLSGEEFYYEINGLPAGERQYFFEFQVGNELLRYPDTGTLNLQVSQSTQGWDLALKSSTSFAPNTTFKSGNTITIEAAVENLGDHTYVDELIEARLISPNGSTIDKTTRNISSIDHGQVQSYDLNLDIPSNANEGNYKVVVSVSPELDSDLSNNVISIGFSIAEDLGIAIYNSIKGEERVVAENNTNPDYINEGAITVFYINGYRFEVTGIDNDGIVFLHAGRYYKIEIDEIRVFRDLNAAIYVESSYSDATQQVGYIERLEAVDSGPTLSTTNLLVERGGEGVIRISPPSGHTFDRINRSKLIYAYPNSPYNFTDWLDQTNSVGNNSYDLIWKVPNNVTPNSYETYFRNEYNDRTPTFTQLYFTVSDPLPEISSISTNQISALGTIEINGSNFGSNTGKVMFNDLEGSVLNWSNELISVEVPTGVENGSINVVNNTGVSNSMTYEVLSSTGEPIVSQQIPNQVIKAGTSLEISNLENAFWDPNDDILNYSVSINPKNNSEGLTYNIQELNESILKLEAVVEAFGNFTVSITAENSNNLTISQEFNTEVNVELVPDFIADLTSGESPLTVSFTDQSSPEPVITSWKWDFNNDSVINSEEKNPTYTYSEPGLYTVKLTVGDGQNEKTITKINLINVEGVESTEPIISFNENDIPHYIEYDGIGFNIDVENTGGGTLNWTSTSPEDWIDVDVEILNEDTGEGTIHVYVHSYEGCGSFDRLGKIEITSSNASNSPQSIEIYQTGWEYWSEAPDLVAKSVSGPSEVRVGEDATIAFSYSNSGDEVAPSGWTGAVYLSSNNEELDGSEIELYSFIEDEQLCYEDPAKEVEQSITIPQDIPEGVYYYALKLDINNQVWEWEDQFPYDDFDNNTIFGESVTITDSEVIAAPIQISPQDEAENVSITPRFEWTDVEGAEYYILHASGLNPSEMVIDVEVSGTSYTPSEPLVENRIHHWRVRAVVDKVEGQWSPIWEFKTNEKLAFTGELSSQILRAGDTRNQVAESYLHEGVESLFSGGNGTLAFTAESSNEALVEVDISEENLLINVVGSSIDEEIVMVTIKATDENENTAEGTIEITVHPAYGDLNADGRVNSFDASQILGYVVELINFNEVQEDIADLNQDGRINSFDASLVLQYSVELIDELPWSSTSSMMAASTTQSSTSSGSDKLIWGEPGESDGHLVLPLVINSNQSVYSIDFTGEFNTAEGTLEKIVFSDLPDGWIVSHRIGESGSISIALAGTTPFINGTVATLHFKLQDFSRSMSLDGGGFVNTSGFVMDNIEVQEIIEEFTLENNFPNPFNPSTTIRYQLPTDSEVSIELFNVAGQKVMQVVEAGQSAGSHTLSLDMSAFSSGVYFIRFVARSDQETFITTNKITLIK